MTEWDLVPHILFVCLFGILANYWLAFMQLLKVYEKQKKIAIIVLNLFLIWRNIHFPSKYFLKVITEEESEPK